MLSQGLDFSVIIESEKNNIYIKKINDHLEGKDRTAILLFYLHWKQNRWIIGESTLVVGNEAVLT